MIMHFKVYLTITEVNNIFLMQKTWFEQKSKLKPELSLYYSLMRIIKIQTLNYSDIFIDSTAYSVQ